MNTLEPLQKRRINAEIMNGEICRTCLGDGTRTSIFLRMSDSETICSKIVSLAKIEIQPDDGLPSSICFKCIDILDQCTKFVQQCINSNQHLQDIKDSIKVERKCNEDVISENYYTYTQSDSEIVTPEEGLEQKYSTLKTKKKRRPNQSNHEDKHLSNTQKQQCFTCGKVMSSRFRLKTHMRTHTGERPFSCPHCSKNFSLAQNLKVHLRIHTGEKPLKCSVCEASFAHSAGLAAHQRKHTGQTPYHCTLCPRSFRTIGHMQYHIRRHTGERKFECDSCSRTFITRSDLKQHLKSHSGVRAHVCCVCGLCLSRASHLKRHMKHLHNGNKPFTCTRCSSKFTHKTEYEKHKKKHVEDKEDNT